MSERTASRSDNKRASFLVPGCSTFSPIPDRKVSHTATANGQPAMLKNILVLSLLVGATLCRHLQKRWDDFKVKHEWIEGAPRGWKVLGPAPSDERLNVRIGLKEDRIEDLIENLFAVSDPSHHRYAASPGCAV